jgi:predicted nicotinamide N-methyase
VTTSPESALPFDITVDEFQVGSHRLRLWRPVEPQEVDDPGAERGLAGPVWAQTWTSGFVLADLVARQSLRGVRVLDVGCGLGLVGLAAARAGADVTVSDRSRYALAFTAANAEDNGLAVRAVRCEWRDPTPLELDGPWDLVLGSDILYDDSSARHLLALLGRVIGPAGEVWLADPGRPPASSFLAAASTHWQLSGRACSHGVRLHRLVRKPHPPTAQARTVTQTQ